MTEEKTYEAIGKLIYGVQRFGGVERMLALQDDPQVPPDVASAGRQLAERHQRIMAGVTDKAAPLGDAEVGALLQGIDDCFAVLARHQMSGRGG